MSLQPPSHTPINRTTTSPFLLRLFWRPHRSLEPWEFAIAPPLDTSSITDYSSLLPAPIRQHSVQIYTWPDCTLGELTGLISGVLPAETMLGGPSGGNGVAVGTRLSYKLIFPDTRSGVSESGRGKWVDKPLGSVVITGGADDTPHANGDGDSNAKQENKLLFEGDAEKTLSDARFVIGDYIACTIYPPQSDGRPVGPPVGRAPRGGDPYIPPRGPPRGGGENGYYPRGGSYRGGRGPPPPGGDWRRGERPPDEYRGARDGYRGGGGGGGRPY